MGRLAVWESWAVGLQLGHARSLGQWKPDGSLDWNGGESYDYSDGLTTAQAWAIFRLHDRVQLQGWIPVAVEDRYVEDRTSGAVSSQIGWGFGDAGAAVRLDILKIGEHKGVPSIAVTAGALAPTGARPEETSLAATGRGTWGGSLAIEAEYALVPWFVKLDAGITGFLPFRRPDIGVRQQLGSLLQVTLSTGREIVRDKLVGAVAIAGEWQGPYALDGDRVAASRAYQYTLAGSLSWAVSPQWTLVGNVTNDVWPFDAGMNCDARVGFTLGIRYARF